MRGPLSTASIYNIPEGFLWYSRIVFSFAFILLLAPFSARGESPWLPRIEIPLPVRAWSVCRIPGAGQRSPATQPPNSASEAAVPIFNSSAIVDTKPRRARALSYQGHAGLWDLHHHGSSRCAARNGSYRYVVSLADETSGPNSAAPDSVRWPKLTW